MENGIPEAFWKKVAAAKKRALMLDYDGTLAPFTVDRDCAVPYPGVREAIIELMEQGTRIVVISGRRAMEVNSLLRTTHIPEIWGLHGFEKQMPDGSVAVGASSSGERSAIVRAAETARELAGEPAVEQKLSGVAVHFRAMSPNDAEMIKGALVAKWKELGIFRSFTVREFDGGIEMRLWWVTKANAVLSVLSGADEGRAAAYLGDDDTDEDAFRAIKGKGLGVLVRPEFRETEAEAWIRPPEELMQFFGRWLAACSSGRESEVKKDD